MQCHHGDVDIRATVVLCLLLDAQLSRSCLLLVPQLTVSHANPPRQNPPSQNLPKQNLLR